mgnify:CR=1 FL=1
MSIEILMPALSPTMSEGKLTKWLVNEGDKIKAGDLIAEIETDKAIMEFESAEDGILKKIIIPESDENITVNQPIAILDTDFPTHSQQNNQIEKSIPKSSKKHNEQTLTEVSKTTKKEAVSVNYTDTNEKPKKKPTNQRIKISPIAKKMAFNLGLNIADLSGTGPGGRIVKADIEQHTKENNSSRKLAEEKNKIVGTHDLNQEPERIELSPMRRTIADRLTVAKREIPHFYLRKRARVDKLLEARETLNESLIKRDIKISLNDMIIKAVGQALLDHPDCNVTWGGDCIMKHKAADIAVAVAIPGGLLTPVLRNVASKSLSEISQNTKDLIIRSKDKKLAPIEFSGGTTTISNLGMFGIDSFDAIINSPHGSILAVSRTEIVPILNEESNFQKATVMNLTLSVDHRVIDGAVGSAFLASIVSFLEDPITLLA